MDTNSSYRPYEHIKSWQAVNKKTGSKETILHYPTEWRLYELATLFPEANFATEILHINEEADFVVVRVSLFLGSDYASSAKKTQSVSQGRLAEIDKVESKAQARCARLWGLGTAHALASAPKKPEIDPSLKDKANELFDKAKLLGTLKRPNMSAFIALITETVDNSIASPEDITGEHLDILEAFLNSKEVQ